MCCSCVCVSVCVCALGACKTGLMFWKLRFTLPANFNKIIIYKQILGTKCSVCFANVLADHLFIIPCSLGNCKFPYRFKSMWNTVFSHLITFFSKSSLPHFLLAKFSNCCTRYMPTAHSAQCVLHMWSSLRHSH
jgi:hypothetical protein